jgi:uncharacterized protein with ParB-like and HNH nuclease domain
MNIIPYRAVNSTTALLGRTLEDVSIKEYDITASPNDFNVKTIFDFIESGSVKIPGFQRNYVWDIKRASKLIESIIIGIPIPQVFLYEEERNSFLVIDGQQRLMSVYYFIKQRFPKEDRRMEIRKIFEEQGQIPDVVLQNDEYFTKFNLVLPAQVPNQANKFHKSNYATLGDYKTTFELRTIRNIIVKQNFPRDDDSSVYEIFNRLNSGGVNLTPQEIRVSLYHSHFFRLLDKLNLRPEWRRLLGVEGPDLHLKDIEILLRGFALLVNGEKYAPSMTKFLNAFAKEAKGTSEKRLAYLEALFDSFLAACAGLGERAFASKDGKRFNISTFDAVFVAVCADPFGENQLVSHRLDQERLNALRSDPEFLAASQKDTTGSANVKLRRRKAKEMLVV